MVGSRIIINGKKLRRKYTLRTHGQPLSYFIIIYWKFFRYLFFKKRYKIPRKNYRLPRR